LRGAIPGLQRVASLGATVIYLGPIAKRSQTPHASPYNIADYNAIDSSMGMSRICATSFLRLISSA